MDFNPCYENYVIDYFRRKINVFERCNNPNPRYDYRVKSNVTLRSVIKIELTRKPRAFLLKQSISADFKEVLLFEDVLCYKIREIRAR